MTGPEIERLIGRFLETSPSNTLDPETGEKAWEAVLVGFASGADPLFAAYKDHVGPFHFTPEEIFNLTYPDTPARADELTVISWVLPQREAVKADNRAETRCPSRRWVMARLSGEGFNEALRGHVAAELTRAGFPAVAPMSSPHWTRAESPKYGKASRWSERHAAYAAGLGTFGLSDGLITERGKAHRVGSVVARIGVPATPRPYTDHHAYCLFYATGKCMVCARRCPVGAISERGHDKIACGSHERGVCMAHAREHYGLDGDACGLCQTGVPCESGIPKAALRRRKEHA